MFRSWLCKHENVRGIYGDEIISTCRAWFVPAFARVRCLGCGKALYNRKLTDEIMVEDKRRTRQWLLDIDL